jgi:phosphoserine phosphatase RsbU/P
LLLAILRTLLDEPMEPAALMERLNVQISRHAPASRFITLFFSVYDPATGQLTYINAGHIPGLVRRRGGQFERLADGGVALGMFEGSRYQTGRTILERGDMLVLYSDGISEAENPAGRPFEDAGIETLITDHAAEGLEVIARTTFKAVERHAQDTRFADDLTILLMRRDAAVSPATV